MAARTRVNVSSTERTIRVTYGFIGVISGVTLLPAVVMVSTGMLLVILIGTGLYAIVTGITGYCPFYNQLGFSFRRKTKRDGR